MGGVRRIVAVCLSVPATSPVPAPSPTPPTPAPPSDPPPTVPSISNISAAFTTDTCTRAADGLHAMALVITFDYVDGPGDLSSGRIPLYSTSTETIYLVDANGNASNSLSVTMTRPAGDK